MKKLKITGVCLLVILMLLSVAGCGKKGVIHSVCGGKTKAFAVEEEYLTPVLDALDKQDAKTIYNMYAKDVQDADEDLIKDIENVLSMYRGTHEKHDFVDGSTNDRRNEEKRYKQRFTASYRVDTTEESYMLLIAAHTKGLDQASTGLYSLALIRLDDYEAGNELEELYYAKDGAIPCDWEYIGKE